MTCPYCHTRFRTTIARLAHLADPRACPARPANRVREKAPV